MKPVTRIHTVSILIISLCSMALSVTDMYALKVLTGISVIALLAVLVLRTSGLLRITFSTFFVISLVLSVMYRIPMADVLDALISHTIFIALFVCTPLIRLPLEAGGYLQKIMPLIKGMPRRLLSPVIIVQNFVLASFLNLAGLRMTDQFFNGMAKASPLAYGRILSRSFSLAAFWTPYFAAFSVAVAYSNGHSTTIMFLGLMFSVSVITVWVVTLLIGQDQTSWLNPFSKQDAFNIAKIVLFFSSLIVCVVLFSHFTHFNVIFIISSLSVVFSLLWCVLLGKLGFYWKAVRNYVSTGLVSIREEAFLFIATGFFASTLMRIGWQFQLPQVNGESAFVVFAFVIVFNVIVVTLALFGIHHLVTITLISTATDWQSFGIAPVVYGVTILLSWCLSATVSPFSPPNLITGRMINREPFKIGPVSNSLFALYMLIGGAIYLTLVNSLLR